MELRLWPFSFPSYEHICFSNSYNNKQRNHERAKAELILAHSVSHALWLVLCQCHHKFGSYNRRRCDVNQSKPWRQVLVNFYCPSLLPKLFVSKAHNQVKIAEWTGALSLNKKKEAEESSSPGLLVHLPESTELHTIISPRGNT